MKIRTVSPNRLALLCTAVVAALLIFSDRASAVSIRDAHELGLVQPSRHSDGSTYINNLIGMAFRSDERANGQYFRSDASTPHAVLPDHMNTGNAGGRSVEVITIPSPGGGPGPAGVPDGGITAMLLGAALGALGMARRYLMS
jgi:hypothetical protein